MMHEHFLPNLLAEVIGATVMGFLVVLMLVAGFKFFDKMLPGIDFEKSLEGQPYAVAIVIVGFFISVAIVMAMVFQGR